LIKIAQLFLINPDGTTIELTTEGPIKDMLKTDECYVLVADDLRKVYLWKGSKSSVRSKFIGAKRSQEIRGQVGMHYSVIPLDEDDEDSEFMKLIGGRTEGRTAKEIKGETVVSPTVHPLRERNVFGAPESADGMNIAGSKTRAVQNAGPLYRGEGSMTAYMQEETQIDIQEIMAKLEEIKMPSGFERELIIIGNQVYSVVEKVQQFLGEKQITKEISKVGAIPEGIFFSENYSPRIISKNGKTLAIEFLKRSGHETRPIVDTTRISSDNGETVALEMLKHTVHATGSLEGRLKQTTPEILETDLSNKDRILNLLRKEALTSNDIANRLDLSKQDTRTYLLRLKKEDKIKTLGKKGRYYIYTYNIPSDTKKISISKLAEVVKEYVELEPSFINEISNKIAELEAKVNTIASKTIEISDKEKLIGAKEATHYK